MKKILIAAVASTAFFSTAAFAAGTATQGIDITATVSPECVIGAIAPVNLGVIPISTTADATGLTISADVPKSTPVPFYMGCNQRMHIALGGRGLVSASNASNPSLGVDGFTNKLNYQYYMNGTPGTPFSGATNGTPSARTGDRDPFYREASIQIGMTQSINAGRRPLAGTDYTDTATLTLTAI
mgnify:CR=1 FL=1